MCLINVYACEGLCVQMHICLSKGQNLFSKSHLKANPKPYQPWGRGCDGCSVTTSMGSALQPDFPLLSSFPSLCFPVSYPSRAQTGTHGDPGDTIALSPKLSPKLPAPASLVAHLRSTALGCTVPALAPPACPCTVPGTPCCGISWDWRYKD